MHPLNYISPQSIMPRSAPLPRDRDEAIARFLEISAGYFNLPAEWLNKPFRHRK